MQQHGTFDDQFEEKRKKKKKKKTVTLDNFIEDPHEDSASR
jgi:hypothetical protein